MEQLMDNVTVLNDAFKALIPQKKDSDCACRNDDNQNKMNQAANAIIECLSKHKTVYTDYFYYKLDKVPVIFHNFQPIVYTVVDRVIFGKFFELSDHKSYSNDGSVKFFAVNPMNDNSGPTLYTIPKQVEVDCAVFVYDLKTLHIVDSSDASYPITVKMLMDDGPLRMEEQFGKGAVSLTINERITAENSFKIIMQLLVTMDVRIDTALYSYIKTYIQRYNSMTYPNFKKLKVHKHGSTGTFDSFRRLAASRYNGRYNEAGIPIK